MCHHFNDLLSGEFWGERLNIYIRMTNTAFQQNNLLSPLANFILFCESHIYYLSYFDNDDGFSYEVFADFHTAY